MVATDRFAEAEAALAGCPAAVGALHRIMVARGLPRDSEEWFTVSLAVIANEPLRAAFVAATETGPVAYDAALASIQDAAHNVGVSLGDVSRAVAMMRAEQVATKAEIAAAAAEISAAAKAAASSLSAVVSDAKIFEASFRSRISSLATGAVWWRALFVGLAFSIVAGFGVHAFDDRAWTARAQYAIGLARSQSFSAGYRAALRPHGTHR
ncbi:MAG: hypothetical protein M3N13_10295 [Candidatus Eremiobacteraeota bacterium]|nr:hypothetical protein [Candidatus Eremiobacteraeota bacterium]